MWNSSLVKEKTAKEMFIFRFIVICLPNLVKLKLFEKIKFNEWQERISKTEVVVIMPVNSEHNMQQY
jgi:hypothetical protein